MLTPFDDYPIHQTAEPIAHPASGDRNVYDRYFFNGYRADASLYFAAAWGLYPNRFVQDAAFSVVRNGEQISVQASRRAPLDRTDMGVGPVTVDVVEPLKQLRVTVGPNDAGVEADLLFTNVTDPLQEPRFTRHAGSRLVMDYTRLTQFGTWRGWITIDGERIEVGPSDTLGSRDRSWGIRGVGERDAGAPSTTDPQFFWLWAPVNFDDTCIHASAQEDGDGRRWHWNGELAPVGGGSVRATDVHWDITWQPGTRRVAGAQLALRMLDGTEHHIDLEPLLEFQMVGLGYLHPERSHGRWQGEEAVSVERWTLADLDPLAMQHLHVQSLCRATWGERRGTGVLEQLAIGRHDPSGFQHLNDGAPPSHR